MMKTCMSEPALVLEADGGSRGNPGPSGAGAVLRTPAGGIIQEMKQYLGWATNNAAEYQGVIMGLRAAAEYKPARLLIRLDSELLVRQLNGQYKVKSPNLRPLYQQARDLLAGIAEVEIIHVPRGQNTLADALANQAMDEAGAEGKHNS
jgi:ribonuclease HI